MELKLTKGKVVIIDECDFEKVSGLKWHYQEKRNTGYAIRSIRKEGKNKTQRLHRLIMDAKKGEIVDHINGDGLDCRRKNLRIVTSQGNSINRRSKPKTSGYKGVSAIKYKCKGGDKILWHARICPNRKCKSLGYYKNIRDAAIAYDKEAIKLYGNLAVLNFKNKENDND